MVLVHSSTNMDFRLSEVTYDAVDGVVVVLVWGELWESGGWIEDFWIFQKHTLMKQSKERGGNTIEA